MTDSAAMLTHINSHFFVVLFALLSLRATILLAISGTCQCLKKRFTFLFAYVIAAFDVGPDWKVVFHDSFVPSVPKTQGAWATIVAILEQHGLTHFF